uniref:Uncharacterized protein n=1 Tax=Avena sativa TaxID=4498 RepID=A0ACD5UCZ7_AVESA
MGSSAGAGAAPAVLICVVALSVFAVASAEPEPEPRYISMEALKGTGPPLSAEPEPRYISMEALKGTGPPSARKLFDPGFCPVQFDEKRQIAKIANKCKGQAVPQPSCCEAFSSVACPYSDLLDEVTNGCSVELLMKIHDQSSLPAQYFAMCGDSAKGLSC